MFFLYKGSVRVLKYRSLSRPVVRIRFSGKLSGKIEEGTRRLVLRLMIYVNPALPIIRNMP